MNHWNFAAPPCLGVILSAAIFVPLIGPPPAPAAAVVSSTVGDPANAASLARQIKELYIAGARRIVVRPGVYQLPADQHAGIVLDHWQDAALIGDNVTLVNTADRGKVLQLRHCSRTTVRGFTLTQTWMSAYQGRITAVGQDQRGAWCNWTPSAGYPVPPANLPTLWLNVIDGKSHHFKMGVYDFYDAPLKSLGKGAFRSHLGGPPVRFEIGDWVVARFGDPPQKVLLDDSRDCTIQGVTLMRNGFAPIFETGGGGNRILDCRWTAGPRPPAATDDPLVTNAADGIHSVAANPGPDIEGCVFEAIFLDDCIAIHGEYQNIRSAEGKTLVVKNGYAKLTVGEPARITDNHGFFAESKVLALKDNADDTLTVTLAESFNVPLPAKISNPLHAGAGYKIIGCRLGDTRSRGILAKGDNGLIRDNEIDHCGMSAISIGPEYDAGESDYCHNVLIEKNLCQDNGRMGEQAAIWIHGDGVSENRIIAIPDNRLVANNAGDIRIEWAQKVQLLDNSFTSPSSWLPGHGPRFPIALEHSAGIDLAGSLLAPGSIYAQPLVRVGDGVSDVTQH